MIWVALVFFILLSGGLAWLNYKTIKKNLQLEDQREALVDTIEESLDMLSDIYDRIAAAAEIPVLSDEPIIRDLLSDIKRLKNAVLLIASKVVVYGDNGENEEDE
jgi:hypothetical protein